VENYLDQYQCQGVLIPRTDRFLSTYTLQPEDNWVEKLSGFTGSAGTLLITKEKDFLFTDSRYTVQAHGQTKNRDKPTVVILEPLNHWLDHNFSGVLLADPWLFSAAWAQRCLEVVHSRWSVRWASIFSKYIKSNVEKEVRWETVPPWAGSFQEKCRSVFSNTQLPFLVTYGADLAWLCNLRGHLSYAPLFHAYGLISCEEGHFHGHLYTPDVSQKTIFSQDLTLWPLCQLSLPSDVFYQSSKTPYGFLNDHPEIQFKQSSLNLDQQRSCKTAKECISVKEAHVIDGVALVQFLHWISTCDFKQQTEWTASCQLEDFRRQCPSYKGPSFPTISAMGKNSAVIHYVPDPLNALPLQDGLYLVDSGGQYCGPEHQVYGTTDVTRTLFLGSGQPSELMKRRFTQVLKGHIALARLIFPAGVSDKALDILARQYLWQDGQDYPHSTGHGVGTYLQVHEMPPAVSAHGQPFRLQEGMVFSNEPGFYDPDLWGIRLESLVLVQRVPASYWKLPEAPDAERTWLRLETITLAPFDRRLIETGHLSDQEKEWIDHYHQTVLQVLQPRLPVQTAAWLKQQTLPL
jgi:Xaa-Pro aminopeptidase